MPTRCTSNVHVCFLLDAYTVSIWYMSRDIQLRYGCSYLNFNWVSLDRVVFPRESYATTPKWTNFEHLRTHSVKTISSNLKNRPSQRSLYLPIHLILRGKLAVSFRFQVPWKQDSHLQLETWNSNPLLHSIPFFRLKLVGVFFPTHPEKYARQIGFIFPKVRGENKKCLKPPPSKRILSSWLMNIIYSYNVT